MTGKGRYQSYRGRRERSSPLLKGAAAVLALLLVAVLAFAVVMGDRVEYTDDGVRFALFEGGKPKLENIEVRLIIDD